MKSACMLQLFTLSSPTESIFHILLSVSLSPPTLFGKSLLYALLFIFKQWHLNLFYRGHMKLKCPFDQLSDVGITYFVHSNFHIWMNHFFYSMILSALYGICHYWRSYYLSIFIWSFDRGAGVFNSRILMILLLKTKIMKVIRS